MKGIKCIYLAWRKGKGERRIIVGQIRRNANEGVRFRYISEGVKDAMDFGFTPYVDFPDINKEYSEKVLDAFGQRLVKTERTDKQKYYDFWEIDDKYKEDKYYMLAYTQGLLPTDNFEFLADFNPIKELCFVSEISGLSSGNVEIGSVNIGDRLRFEYEKDNKYDNYAIKVFKGDTELGYVKKVHNKVFHAKNGDKLTLAVKGMEQNGKVNRIFIKVSF